MRKILVICLLAFFPLSFGAQAAELKVGFFNMPLVVRDCDAYKAKLAELQKEFDSEGKVLEKQNADLQKKVNDFQIQQQALSPEAREDRQVDLARQRRDLEDKMNNYMRKRGAAEKRAQEEINKVIIYAATEYGKREKFSFILEQNTAGAVWLADALDITPQILEESNKVWKAKPKEIFGSAGR